MKSQIMTLALVAACAVAAPLPAAAQDYSEGSKAGSWNMTGEEKAKFSGKVVDILCELSGDCPANCGEGTRQLGVVRADDNALIPVFKNSQPAFNGAVSDLLPYCNQKVEVDGLMVGDNKVNKAKSYQVQFIRRDGEEEWNKTTLWTEKWKENNPEAAKKKGKWFRNDPAILKQIEADGYLGLGKEADQVFIKENY